MKKYTLILLLFLIGVSCEDESEQTKVILICNPSPKDKDLKAGSRLLLEISSYAQESQLVGFRISSFELENGDQILMDSTFTSKRFSYNYIYEVPHFQEDSLQVQLKLRAIDEEGSTQEFKYTIRVVQQTTVLPELTGIVLFSGKAQKPNAFSLQAPDQVFLLALADSASIDVYDFAGEDLLSDELLREWRTNTDIYFSKVNSFNYSAATAATIHNTFVSSISQRYINDIQPNDIILLGKENKGIGVIQIVDVVDDVGVDNDYYRFSIKMIDDL